MTIMNEIVGESGEQGEGCLMTLVVMAVSLVLTVALMAAWAWLL